MIKRYLKRILPPAMSNFVTYIHTQLIYFQKTNLWKQIMGIIVNRKLYKNISRKRIYYICTANYGNLGDHAIAYAEMAFMSKLCPDYEHVEIQDDELLPHLLCLKKYVTNEDVIILTGGGNFGMTYPWLELVRREIIKGCRKCKIILFPQTVDFGRTRFDEREIEKTKKIYENNRNVTIMARERKSFDVMRNMFPNHSVLLMPDIVLTLNLQQNVVRNGKVLLCLRDDGERKLSNDDYERIVGFIKSKGIPYGKYDTETHTHISGDMRYEKLDMSWNTFRESALVITDRLHGMIFSTITGTPCIAIGNYNQKVEGVYEWIKDLGYIIFTNNIDNVISSIQMMMSFPFSKYSEQRFVQLFASAIYSIIRGSINGQI